MLGAGTITGRFQIAEAIELFRENLGQENCTESIGMSTAVAAWTRHLFRITGRPIFIRV